MIIKDLVVTGIVKILRSLNVDTLVADQINGVSKDEINTLHGINGNINQQLTDIGTAVNTANTNQDTWKTQIAGAINGIPKPDASTISNESTLSSYVAEANKVKTTIESATAANGDVLSGKKFVNSRGVIVVGTMPNYGATASGQETIGQVVAHSVGGNNNTQKIYLRMLRGGYVNPLYGDANNAIWEAVAPYSMVADSIGLDTSKMLNNYTLLGKTGEIPVNHSYQSVHDITYGGIVRNPINRTDMFPSGWYYYIGIPWGYYPSMMKDEYPGVTEIQIDEDIFNARIGLTADKLKYNWQLGHIRGTFTGDADAAAGDIISGKIAYVKGSKVTGNLPNYGREPLAKSVAPAGSNLYMYLPNVTDSNPEDKGVIQRALYRPLSDFGDASASDVLVGKTFTSSSGLKIAGTMKIQGTKIQGTLLNSKYTATTIPSSELQSSSREYIIAQLTDDDIDIIMSYNNSKYQRVYLIADGELFWCGSANNFRSILAPIPISFEESDFYYDDCCYQYLSNSHANNSVDAQDFELSLKSDYTIRVWVRGLPKIEIYSSPIYIIGITKNI